MKRYLMKLTQLIQQNKKLILIIKPILISIVVTVIIFLDHKFTNGSITFKVQYYLKGFFNKPSYYLILIILPIIITFVFDGVSYWAERSNLTLSEHSYLALLTAFNNVVSFKTDRFYNFSPAIGSDTFDKITQPDDQIKELLIQLYIVFRELTNDKDIKLVLAKANKNHLTGHILNAPSGAIPSISSEDITHGTFLSYVLKLNNAKYITDLVKEKKRQKKSPRNSKRYLFVNEDDEIGGIVGFPIRKYKERKSILYVLTIRSETITMNKNFIKKYKGIIEMFEKRFQLESELESLKIKHRSSNEI